MNANKAPISEQKFIEYIETLMEDWDFYDKCYELGIDGIIDHIKSFDLAVTLLGVLFNDTNQILDNWIYEQEFGLRSGLSIHDIYHILINK